MRKIVLTLTAVTLAGAGLLSAAKKPAADAKKPAATKPAAKPYWVEPMKKVHANFKGDKGTFAHFGDSITVTMAFWSSLKYSHKNMDKETQRAFDLTKKYMQDKCWAGWKGGQFGNTGMMTIRWAHKNVDTWLKKMKPEVVLIMFGTNDLHALGLAEYRTKTAEVVQKCLDNGTIVILSTIPPRHGFDAKANRRRASHWSVEAFESPTSSGVGIESLLAASRAESIRAFSLESKAPLTGSVRTLSPGPQQPARTSTSPMVRASDQTSGPPRETRLRKLIAKLLT